MAKKIQRKKYLNDFLDKVLVRVDFDSDLPIAATGPDKSTYKIVANRFPLTQERKILGKELIVGSGPVKEKEVETKEWHYFGEDRKKKLIISPSYMLIEYLKYEYYEVLKDDFLGVLGVLATSYPNLQIKRLGLRYIDNISLKEGNAADWRKYLKAPLLASINITKDKSVLARVLNVLEFNYGNYLLRFQYGLFNPDYPAPIVKNTFTLDHDIYVNKLVDIKDIESILDEFHQRINESFESVITDNLRKIMKPVSK